MADQEPGQGRLTAPPIGHTPAVLSVPSQLKGGRRDPERAARVALAGCVALDGEQSLVYADMIRASLDKAAQAALEELMESSKPYEFRSEFARKYIHIGKAEGLAEGLAEGKAKDILRVLAVRKIEVSEAQRAQVLGCKDIGQLDRWLDQAVTATRAGELFV